MTALYTSPIIGNTSDAWGWDSGTGTPDVSNYPIPPYSLIAPTDNTIPAPGGAIGGLGGLNLSNLAGSNWLGYGALAYGGYRAFRSRRVNLVTLGLLVYGLWAIGWISPSLLPRDENGNINWIVLGLSSILPPTAAALVGGVSGIIISTLARGLFKRRRTFRKRFSSYRRTYRRSSYRRRRY